MEKSSLNKGVLDNFILHLTHCGNHGLDNGFKDIQRVTPEQLYKAVENYIEEDHVDGKGNPNDHIVTYGAESSFQTEDRDKEYPEQVVVVADFGEETQTIATFGGGQVDEMNQLLKIITR